MPARALMRIWQPGTRLRTSLVAATLAAAIASSVAVVVSRAPLPWWLLIVALIAGWVLLNVAEAQPIAIIGWGGSAGSVVAARLGLGGDAPAVAWLVLIAYVTLPVVLTILNWIGPVPEAWTQTGNCARCGAEPYLSNDGRYTCRDPNGPVACPPRLFLPPGLRPR